jgi:hypothetical protein
LPNRFFILSVNPGNPSEKRPPPLLRLVLLRLVDLEVEGLLSLVDVGGVVSLVDVGGVVSLVDVGGVVSSAELSTSGSDSGLGTG